MQTLNNQFGREYRLTFKNLENGVEFDIAGLRIQFDIELFVDQKDKTNRGTISIYNLKEETFKAMDTRNGYIWLNAGYKGNSGLILEGDVIRVSTKRSGPDKITEFELAESFRDLTRKKIVEARPENSTLGQLIDIVADSMGLARSNLNGQWNDILFPYGYPVYGTGKQVLDEVCRTYDLEWKIIGRGLVVTPRYGLLSSQRETAYVLNAQSGLIDIPYRYTEQVSKTTESEVDADNEKLVYKAPSLKKDGTLRKSKNKQIQRSGVRCKALINPNVKPNTLLKLETETDLLAGFYRVRSVKYSGDSRGNEWYMDIYGDSVDGKEY